MKNDLIIILLTVLILTLAVPLVQYQFNSEKAFTSDNLISKSNDNI